MERIQLIVQLFSSRWLFLRWQASSLLPGLFVISLLLYACGTTPAQTIATPEQTASAQNTPTKVSVSSLDPAIRCYVDAVNEKQLDTLVQCFHPDAVVIDVSRRIEGAEAIRTWANNEVIGGTLTVLDVTPQPQGTRLLVRWAPEGSSGWNAYYTFTVRDGRISQAYLQYA